MRNYSGFYEGLSGYELQVFSDCGVKTRPSKVKVPI